MLEVSESLLVLVLVLAVSYLVAGGVLLSILPLLSLQQCLSLSLPLWEDLCLDKSLSGQAFTSSPYSSQDTGLGTITGAGLSPLSWGGKSVLGSSYRLL